MTHGFLRKNLASIWRGKNSELLSKALSDIDKGNFRDAFRCLNVVLDRTPDHNQAWAKLLEILPDVDSELAYWIGLKARSRRRSDVLAAAVFAMLGQQGPPAWLLDVLPDDEWPRSLSAGFWNDLGDCLQCSAPQSLVDAVAREHPFRDAEQLLILLTATTPALEPRLKLISLLQARWRLAEAVAVAERAVALWPQRFEPRLALGRLQFRLDRHQQSAETLRDLVAMAPGQASVWYEYAQIGNEGYDLPFSSVDEAYERASELGSHSPQLLEGVAQHFLYERKFARATTHYERLLDCYPSSKSQPAVCRDYAKSLRGANRIDEADRLTSWSVDRCRELAKQVDEEEWETIKSQEAQLLFAAGRNAEARAVLASIRNRAKPHRWNYSRSEYLPDTPARLRHFESIVTARDVVLFAPGPSFADFAARMSEVRDLDFTTAMINAFPPIDEAAKRHLGRGVDLLMFTHPTTLRSFLVQLEEFLGRSSPNMVLTTHYAISSFSEEASKAFLSRHDARLLFFQPIGGPPLPSRPLHFESGHSLSMMLPLLLLGRPRRVFLVGADSGAHPKYKRPYFFYNEVDATEAEREFIHRHRLIEYKGLPDRLAEANRRLRLAAHDHDRAMRTAFSYLSGIFNIPIPPIFNVCPHSAHEAFPRIDCDTAIAMLRNIR